MQPWLPQKHPACQSLGRHMVVTPVPQMGSPVVWLVSVWLTSLHHEHFWCAKHHALFGEREDRARCVSLKLEGDAGVPKRGS